MVILRQLFFLCGDLEFNMIYIAVIIDKNMFTFFGVQMFPLDCEYILVLALLMHFISKLINITCAIYLYKSNLHPEIIRFVN